MGRARIACGDLDRDLSRGRCIEGNTTRSRRSKDDRFHEHGLRDIEESRNLDITGTSLVYYYRYR